MKTIKILTLLVLFSLQAGATGYSHNMFVAHKKLQAGKECTQPSERIVAKKARPSKVVKHHASVKRVTAFTAQFSSNTEPMTLNERILEAGPSSFFTNEEDNGSDDSIVTKLIAFVRCTIYAFIGLPS
ncbi:hypothetical protein MUK70_23240 [Dyadobacter chenwenxiniae]|uniref:Uncharacterized protein n=1 Tax=Dyadobacter chenwenxiniae TaxID=2906456 RepID=A0A9X1PLJ8_9BACT|nr:hypothetical protein [Dyadobacter chenwenxiniae]MCF0062159.1 hypothetical protein [Dyadobacter chenwenxiniae]UON81963.1 hypothetical protein MUK70_23240 [Dyadobacter chenwenxiniae]